MLFRSGNFCFAASYLPLRVSQRTCDPHHQGIFSGAVAGDLEASARGVSHILSLYFVIVLPSIFFVSLVLPFVCSTTEKHKKIKIPAPSLFRFCPVIMFCSLLAINGYFL